MELLFPDAGLNWSLLQLVGPGLVYHLYENDYEPTLDSVLSDFDESTYSGYGPITVAAADWREIPVAEHLGGLTADPITFRNLSGSTVDVFGFFITDSGMTQLLAAARLDTAPEQPAPGQGVTITPLLGSYSGLDQ